MALNLYGGTDDDRVESVWPFGRRQVVVLAPGTRVRFYDAAGNENTALFSDAAGTVPVAAVYADDKGYWPADLDGVYIEDGDAPLYAKGEGGSKARLVVPRGGGADAGLSARVDTLEQNTPTLEEQALSVVLDPASITAAASRAVHVAMFPCRLDQVALAVQTAVAESDTDYWTVELVRYRDGLAESVAAKTTQTVASGGEGMTAFTGWTFDVTTFTDDAEMVKDEVLAVTFTPTGAPAPLVGPVLSFRAPAADVTYVPPPAEVILAEDSFDRADSAVSLGTADSGHVWTAQWGTWGISGNAAYLAASGAANNIATVDAAAADVIVEAKLTNTDGLAGVALRYVSAASLLYTNRVEIRRRDGGASTSLGTFSTAFDSGDTIRVEAIGDAITVYRQAASAGAFVEVWSGTDTLNQTVTLHGICHNSTAGAGRIDDFRVLAP